MSIATKRKTGRKLFGADSFIGVVVALLTVGVVLCSSCGGGRTVLPWETNSDVYFTRLLASRIEAGIRVPSGVEFSLRRVCDRDSKSDQFGLEVVWVSLRQARLKVSQIGKRDDFDSLYAWRAGPRDLVLVNGGFWGSKEQGPKEKPEIVNFPMGLVVSTGRRISAIDPEMAGGLVFQQGTRVDVLAFKEFQVLENDPDEAVQCKPILVDRGMTAMRSDNHKRDDRLAIGIDANGGVIVALATHPQGAFTLKEFSRFLMIPTGKGGPGCVRALNLDGGSGAHMYLPSLNMHFGRHGSSYINNVLHLAY